MARLPLTRAERLKKLRTKWIALVQVWLASAAMLSQSYHDRFLKKTRVYDSKFTGYQWMRELLSSDSEVRCFNAFRMETHVFSSLCLELCRHYGLRPSRRMSVMEKVGLFLHTLAVGLSNRGASERFQRSGDTVSRVFHEVLEAFVGRKKGFDGMVARLVEPHDRTFEHMPNTVVEDVRYTVFKGAIGCIDGCHIECCIPEALQFAYRGRKGFCSFNVMAICDLDMHFSYISVSWEGSAHDARVLDHARTAPEMNFPEPPPGRYYLADKGYANQAGFLVPYSGENYHKSDFKRRTPQNIKEAFNRLHSSLRTTIERCFGVLKKRWQILNRMPSFSIETQIDIISACFGLHNFILQHRHHDAILDEDIEPIDLVRFDADERARNVGGPGMSGVRDRIAAEIWMNKTTYAWMF